MLIIGFREERGASDQPLCVELSCNDQSPSQSIELIPPFLHFMQCNVQKRPRLQDEHALHPALSSGLRVHYHLPSRTVIACHGHLVLKYPTMAVCIRVCHVWLNSGCNKLLHPLSDGAAAGIITANRSTDTFTVLSCLRLASGTCFLHLYSGGWDLRRV